MYTIFFNSWSSISILKTLNRLHGVFFFVNCTYIDCSFKNVKCIILYARIVSGLRRYSIYSIYLRFHKFLSDDCLQVVLYGKLEKVASIIRCGDNRLKYALAVTDINYELSWTEDSFPIVYNITPLAIYI